MLKKVLRNAVPLAYLICKGVKIDFTWDLFGIPRIKKNAGADIIIGKRFCMVSNSRYNSIGVFQPVMLYAVGKNSRIEIGNDVGISGATVSTLKSVTIGDNVLIGSGALIVDNDAHPIKRNGRRYGKKFVKSEPIVIGNEVFIGARAIILKGVTIGDGSTVGAGSVVTHSIPPSSIVAGNPASMIRKI